MDPWTRALASNSWGIGLGRAMTTGVTTAEGAKVHPQNLSLMRAGSSLEERAALALKGVGVGRRGACQLLAEA